MPQENHMSLDEYGRKRNFRKSPEPKPRILRTASEDRGLFVIQKHKARRLHYDFRITNLGVLKSWVIPKGISMNPKTKRLAVQVEDHPVEYKDFEGSIPEGSYGAGNVIIWDEGTYSCGDGTIKGIEKCVKESLIKGHLDFALHGKKVNGEFTLVRLRNLENQWLLLKRNDIYARESFEFDESSVRTGTSAENTKTQRARKQPNLLSDIDFNGAVKSELPLSVKPMLATLIDEPFDHKDWIFEVKWDGYRSLAEINNGKVRLYSRNGKAQNEKYPLVAENLRGLSFNALLDGEIVVVDKQGLPNFQMLQNYGRDKEGTLIYYVFDILYAGEYDIRMLSLKRRKTILEKILPRSKMIRLSDHTEKDGKAFYRAAEENGLEGIMAKDSNSLYRSGIRTRDWLKIKIQKRQEVVIGGFTKPRASRKYFGALVISVYEGKDLIYAGRVGTGFDEENLRLIYQKLKPLTTNTWPFAKRPKTNTPVTWVKPILVCEVKFKEWTNDGHMRMPIFLGLREDKKASAVIKEMPQKVRREHKIQTRAVLTNLNKVYWPKEGFTKKDVIEYYDGISKWIMPYLLDRPQSLNRHPDGIEKENFFQKDIRNPVPDFVKTAKIFSESENRELNYIICQNKDTLLYLANLGCIEINTFNSVMQHLDKPDYLILDFDPVEVPFSKVVEIVLAAKKILDEIDLPGFCKTSGSRGMHIYVPLRNYLDYRQARDFSRLIYSAIVMRHPDLTSLERSPAKRKGKVYLDYLQNKFGATMAVPYSLRPRPGAPVSSPLAWSEVTTALNPLDFNIRTMLNRLAKKGDLWKDLFKETINTEKSLEKLERLLHGRKLPAKT